MAHRFGLGFTTYIFTVLVHSHRSHQPHFQQQELFSAIQHQTADRQSWQLPQVEIILDHLVRTIRDYNVSVKLDEFMIHSFTLLAIHDKMCHLTSDREVI